MSESFDLEVLRHSKEGSKVLLGDVDLAVIHEVENTNKVGGFDTLQVHQGMVVLVSAKHGPIKKS